MGIPLAVCMPYGLEDQGARTIAMLWLPAFCLVMLSLARTRVKVDSEGIEYRTLFRNQVLRFEEIRLIQVHYGVDSWPNVFRPSYSLDLIPGTGSKPMRINLKLFPWRIVNQLRQLAQNV